MHSPSLTPLRNTFYSFNDASSKFAWKENSAVTGETDEYTDDYVHDDYVQPTTKPLVFTQVVQPTSNHYSLPWNK